MPYISQKTTPVEWRRLATVINANGGGIKSDGSTGLVLFETVGWRRAFSQMIDKEYE